MKSRYRFPVDHNSEPLTVPNPSEIQQTKPKGSLDRGYLVICWNDPVNIMDFVTHVFQTVFAWPRSKAEKHMLEVHHKGKSLLAREPLEKAEHYVHQLQSFGLHATLEREP